jgi:hypothetical protein
VSARVETLAEVEAEVWRQLALCAGDKTHPWRTSVLATIHGERADARLVVIREVDTRQKQLIFYTDERAGKVAQLLNHPHGTMVMWCPKLAWQLRCRVRLAMEMSGLAASSRWARIRLSPAAQDYLSPLPPGTALPAVPAHPPVARDYFAVIDASIEAIDWLELHPDGHRRAIFDGQGARWVQP